MAVRKRVTKTSAAPAKRAPVRRKGTPSATGAGRRYAPHPMLAREASIAAKVAEATGRSMDEWVRIAAASGIAKTHACAAWLAAEHGLSGHQAMWVASYATSGDSLFSSSDPGALVDALYSGAKAALRPLHEAVVDLVAALGDDVIVTSCKTIVPCYRKHVFAELRPVEGGVAVALALGDVPETERLTRSPHRAADARLGHQVVVRSARDLDAEFRAWLAQAYAQGAGKIARTTSAEVPADFARALRASKAATATWGTCTPAMRRDFIVWIDSAKQEATRTRRVEASVANLAAGKRRTY